jgi:HTH-type transcriptional regulator / antitoxin HigA
VIRTEKENEACTELLYELDRRSKKLTSAEKERAELLTLLIEDFEDRHYQLPGAKPLEVLQFLIDQQGLLQKDLADVLGTPSIVSEVLSGKNLTRTTSNASAAASTSPPNCFSSFSPAACPKVPILHLGRLTFFFNLQIGNLQTFQHIPALFE